MTDTNIDNTGWVKLHRRIIKWEWYTDLPVKVLFIHLLLSANHEDRRWKGEEVKRGELITSTEHLANETGLSVQQVKTAMAKLIKSGEITKRATNSYTLINVVNYTVYQSFDDYLQPTDNQRATNGQPTDNQRVTTNKNYKNYKNKKNSRKHAEKEYSFDIKEIEQRSILNDEYDV